MADTPTIIYNHTDEVPPLGTRSFLPVLRTFTAGTKIGIETRDISLASRALAHFSDRLTQDQCVDDALAALGELVGDPSATMIKLPNVSASLLQLKAAKRDIQCGARWSVYDLLVV